ncbi:SPRY domain protein [compost metagenome]
MIKKVLKRIGIITTALLISFSLFSFSPSVSKAQSERVTWTNGSLEANLPGSKGGANAPAAFKTNIGKTTGKWYWEITIIETPINNNNSVIGIVGDTTTNNDANHGWQYLAYSSAYGEVGSYSNRSNYIGPSYNGDVIGIALDLVNDTIIWYKNGESGGQNSLKPSTLPGEQVFPFVANGTMGDGRTLIANFGASDFKYSVPEGFLPYDGSSSTPTDPTDPQPTGDRAILTVTMTTGLEKEFDLPMSEVEAFMSWYDAKENGTGPAKYGINKHNNNKGPFSKRTDYVIFKNILSFEVSEYSTTN